MAFPCRGTGTGNFTTPPAHSKGRNHTPGTSPFLAPSAPAGSAAAAAPKAGGGRAPGAEGARRDSRPPHRPGSGSSGRPEWLPMLRRLGQRPAGGLDQGVRRAAPHAGSSWRGSCVRRVRSSQRKGRAPSSSRRPPEQRLLTRAGGPRAPPIICIALASTAHPPHLHTALGRLSRDT